MLLDVFWRFLVVFGWPWACFSGGLASENRYYILRLYFHKSVQSKVTQAFFQLMGCQSSGTPEKFDGPSGTRRRWFLPIFACRGGPGSAAPRAGAPAARKKIICFWSREPFTKIFLKRKPRENLTRTLRKSYENAWIPIENACFCQKSGSTPSSRKKKSAGQDVGTI